MATAEQALYAATQINNQKLADDDLRAACSGVNDVPAYLGERANDMAHLHLREQSALPIMRMAVSSLTGRLKVTGVKVRDDETRSELLWQAWQQARMDGRQRAAIEDALTIGRGVISVWPERNGPRITVENPSQCWFEKNESAFGYEWCAKVWATTELKTSGVKETAQFVTVYEHDLVTTFELRAGRWETTHIAANPYRDFGLFPLVAIAPDRAPDGGFRSWAERLIPGARAINSMRFNLLLAGHSAAFRQLVVSGYDPVERDENGNVQFTKNPDGTVALDANGYPIPVMRPLRLGMDSVLALSDPQASMQAVDPVDLKNYTDGLEYLLTSFAAAASMPPHIVGAGISDMSAEAMELMASQQKALVSDFQFALGEDMELAFDLIACAMNMPLQARTAEIVWDHSDNRTLSQVSDFISKTAAAGVSPRLGLMMLPGSTEDTVDGWIDTPEPKDETVARERTDPAADR